jgi:hypothetical protein
MTLQPWVSSEPAHSPFGGSGATRVLRCPASVVLVEKVPAHLRKSSVYAERGTALHTAMARLIERECTLDDLIGQTIDNYTITRDDTENSLRPALAYVDALLGQPDAEYSLEQRVAFPTIEGAFGTCDLIVRVGSTIYVVDFKFGAGVRVLALYPDGDEDIINGQLLFYAAAARYSLPKFFAGVEHIVLTILQPQSVEPDAEMISAVAVTPAELDAFIALYRAACEEALLPEPRLQRGEHCRFCPARPICPAHTCPLFDLSMFEIPARSAPDYYQALSRGLALFNDVKEIGKALHDQAKATLLEGHDVPDFALTEGRTERSWHDEDAARAQLLELGLTYDDIVAEAMRSVKQIETRAKSRGLKIPPELIAKSRSGVSLVRAENAHAPILSRSALIQSWAEVITAIQKGRRSK